MENTFENKAFSLTIIDEDKDKITLVGTPENNGGLIINSDRIVTLYRNGAIEVIKFLTDKFGLEDGK